MHAPARAVRPTMKRTSVNISKSGLLTSRWHSWCNRNRKLQCNQQRLRAGVPEQGAVPAKDQLDCLLLTQNPDNGNWIGRRKRPYTKVCFLNTQVLHDAFQVFRWQLEIRTQQQRHRLMGMPDRLCSCPDRATVGFVVVIQKDYNPALRESPTFGPEQNPARRPVNKAFCRGAQPRTRRRGPTNPAKHQKIPGPGQGQHLINYMTSGNAQSLSSTIGGDGIGKGSTSLVCQPLHALLKTGWINRAADARCRTHLTGKAIARTSQQVQLFYKNAQYIGARSGSDLRRGLQCGVTHS